MLLPATTLHAFSPLSPASPGPAFLLHHLGPVHAHDGPTCCRSASPPFKQDLEPSRVVTAVPLCDRSWLPKG
ncbi:hypothetical protein DFH07DRAFT_1058825 [Mycena maculata]|uniref:Uncharacterized protein n=1 Tax=Mycena maculata TaxID=230809 RepID=A0AAD7JMG4_9AGAR|nr:hypothetical protein DFH07DRAFT_1058825 [Mycena maculata]